MNFVCCLVFVILVLSKSCCNTLTQELVKPKPVEGCTHKNSTYSPGDKFDDGCEARCLCQSHGHIECVPRCAADPGYDELFCKLVTDPDDPECCKIAVCDKKDEEVDKSGIIIDSAEAYNSTSVKVRVMIPNAKNDTIGSHLKLFYSVMTINETETEKVNDSRHWEVIDVIDDIVKAIATDVYEIDVAGLIPQTDYFMKISALNKSSNTVFVRTFPPGIDITFNGCFHGNQTYEAGEVFFSGCEYKCVCKEGGLRECEERCPIYIDTVGYENCDWGPAPEDPCCTVPICDKEKKKPPPQELDSEHFCIGEDQKTYNVGQTWEFGTCLKRVCKCLLLSNGSSGIECEGGCAPLPSNAQNATPECPSPQLIVPNDPCLCPYVVCHNNLNPLDLPEKPHPSPDKQVCEFKGKQIAIGEEFYDGCRAACHCGHGAKLICTDIKCPHHLASHASDCLEWDIDQLPPIPPNCCPQSKCKNDGSCLFGDVRFPNFKHIPQELLPCGTRCTCINGNVTCENRCSPLSEVPPPNLPCPPALAFRGHLPGDNCCLHWLCREPEKAAHCIHNGNRYKTGEQWDDKGLGYKRRCQCKVSGGKPQVQCYPGGCQPITERFLQPSLDCSNPTIVMPDDPVMCPYVICNDSQETGKELEHVSVIAMNATTVRVRFTLPPLLVGLIGHAELYFTTDVTLPRSQWHVQKFARPKRLFDTVNIEYHLGGLRPDTTYFFQLQIVTEAINTGPESEVYKLHMPTLPPSTTSTTTVPPIIMLDAQINAVAEDYTSLKVSWRPFEASEKRLIDAIQIRHKKVEQDDDEWQLTTMLHRDVTSYILRDLQAGSSYAIDLVFTTNQDINTHIVSTKPIVFEMPNKPKDMFDIKLSLSSNEIAVNNFQTQIKLKGLPHPINQYINVAKISYRSEDNQMHHAFKSINENDELVLDGLEAGKKYKAWIDLYLANGKIITSNPFEFKTNDGPSRHQKSGKIDTSANEAEALREHSALDPAKPYYIALVIVALFAAVTGVGFFTVLYVLLRKQSSAKAPITRVSSEAAYDNPTYKTYDERANEDNIKNGSIQA